MDASIDWDEAAIARLRALWDEGHSTAEIGRRMGTTKNSIVGKAHRLGLPPRPSPIRKVADGFPSPQRPAARRPATAARTAVPASLPVALLVQRAAPALPVRIGPRAGCCWPVGEPRTPEFRYCDALSLPGRPYCEEHAGLAYVRVRDRRENAPQPQA